MHAWCIVPEERLGADFHYWRFSLQALFDSTFFEEIDWGRLRQRDLAVPFLPQLEGNDDTSYFVSKPAESAPKTASGNVKASTDSKNSCSPTNDDDTDFLNFTYNNLATLMRKNMDCYDMELARAGSPQDGNAKGATSSSR